MPFGMVSWVGRMMSVLDRGGDRRREGQFWGEFGRPIVASGDFIA